MSKVCSQCKEPVTGDWIEPLEKQMTERNLCYMCNYWADEIPRVQTNQKCAVIDKKRYTIGDESPSIKHRGFGGHKHVIKFFDDRGTITTTNLWYQGTVPEHLKDQMPNTAVFVN